MTDHEKFGEPLLPQVARGNRQSPYPPQQPPRRRSWPARHKVITGFLAIGAIVLIAGIASAAGSSRPSSSNPAVQTTAPALPGTAVTHPVAEQSSRPAAVTAHVVATFSGSGIENTPQFTVTSTWRLNYSFSCQNFGRSGNFIVSEDGGSDFNGVDVDELAASKTGSTWAYDDSGTHYLAIDSECAWTVKVTDEG